MAVIEPIFTELSLVLLWASPVPNFT